MPPPAEFNIMPVQYAAMVAIEEHLGVDATRLSADRLADGSIGAIVATGSDKAFAVASRTARFACRKPPSAPSRVPAALSA